VGNPPIEIRRIRKRKHPYRRIILILTGAVLAMGLFYLAHYIIEPGSPISTSPAISGEDTSVHFK